MTLISVVVPVYKVQAYLRECLDSILDQAFTDIELIAVDDCSPDGSAAVLAEYAERDPRVTVVSLETNVGLGLARNAGLLRATGDFVWFVDSDDWLDAGALGAVARRLQETAPEVLIVGYDRVHWDGRVARGRALGAAPDDVFTVEDWPGVLDLFTSAWNKVVDREWLLASGLRFEAGWYEDISYTHALIVRSDRISVLDRTCVHYRQRRRGAITSTVDRRHFDLFDHWALAWEQMQADAGRLEVLRPKLAAKMVWHYLVVLRKPQRVPRALRREFFDRIGEHRRRYAPDGYPWPPGAEGLRHRLVAEGRFRTFEALRLAVRWGRVGAARARAAAAVVVAAALKVRRAALLACYALMRIAPVDRHLALYSAYWHRGALCNPEAVRAKAAELAPDVRGVWVVDRRQRAGLPQGADHVVAGTLAYFWAIARARYLVNNVNWPDHLVKRRGSVHVMTHHGTPLKRMGLDQIGSPLGDDVPDPAVQVARADRWDFGISANPHSTQVWERAYPVDCEILEVGYPRNDRLAAADEGDRARAREGLGLDPDARVVLYAPTFREWMPETRRLLDLDELSRGLGPGVVLLVRAHHRYVAHLSTELTRTGAVVDVSGFPSIEELYLASDLLITDYSSVMFDYAVLDRPIVIFAPDWPVYRELRGAYFDLFADPPGQVTTTLDELVEALATGTCSGPEATAARARFRERFCALEDGHAAERVVRRVFGLGLPAA